MTHRIKDIRSPHGPGTTKTQPGLGLKKWIFPCRARHPARMCVVLRIGHIDSCLQTIGWEGLNTWYTKGFFCISRTHHTINMPAAVHNGLFHFATGQYRKAINADSRPHFILFLQNTMTHRIKNVRSPHATCPCVGWQLNTSQTKGSSRVNRTHHTYTS